MYLNVAIQGIYIYIYISLLFAHLIEYCAQVSTSSTFLCDLQPFLNIVPGCIMGGEKKKSEKARYVYLYFFVIHTCR